MNKWAYYNDNDAYVCEWTRNLIKAGLVSDGEVDQRPIQEVRPEDVKEFIQCHFFCGILGWPRALGIALWPPDWPIWTGSCPCQPFSVAGKRRGFADDRDLWPAWFRLIRECRPPVCMGEQVASAADWLARVRSDLEGVGYAVGAMPVQAACAGAAQYRDRYWFVADCLDQRSQVGWPEDDGRDIERTGGRPPDPAVCPAPTQLCEDGPLARRPESRWEREGKHAGGPPPLSARSAECGELRPLAASRGDRSPAGLPAPAAGPGRPPEEPDHRGSGYGAVAGQPSHRPQERCSLPSHAAFQLPPGERSGPGVVVRPPLDGWGSGWTEPEFRSRGFTAAVATFPDGTQFIECPDGKWRRLPPPRVRWLGNGVFARVARLRALGNAIYPPLAAQVIRAYMEARGLQ